MIILDTNVVSEPMKLNGNPAVQSWLDQQTAETLFLTTTSLSELLVGIEFLPDGRRKDGLEAALAELLHGTLYRRWRARIKSLRNLKPKIEPRCIIGRLDKALTPGAKPRCDTVLKLMKALGVQLQAIPAHPRHSR